MKSAEEWHAEFEDTEIPELIEQYGGVPGFIRAIQADAIKACAYIVRSKRNASRGLGKEHSDPAARQFFEKNAEYLDGLFRELRSMEPEIEQEGQ